MDDSKDKKGIVFIYGPKILMDFLCYYCEYGYKYKWSIACFLGRSWNESSMEACYRSEIFEQIFTVEKDYGKIGLKAQGFLFLKMIFYSIIGKQGRLCKKIIAQNIPDSIENYDLIVIPSDFTLVNGACLQITDDLDVAILEDGRMDYIERKWGNIWKSKFSFYEIQGFLLALLGYANIAYHYPLRSTKNADKYVHYPDELIYKKYKSINKLDYNNEEYKEKLDDLFSKTFLVPTDGQFFKGDVLLFTSYFEFFTDDETEVLDATISYINENHKGKKIILKKHPADKKDYVFDPSIDVVEIDKHVPGELLEEKIDVRECIYMYPSTLLDEFRNIIVDYKILYYECLNNNKNTDMAYDQAFQAVLVNMLVDQDKIVHI